MVNVIVGVNPSGVGVPSRKETAARNQGIQPTYRSKGVVGGIVGYHKENIAGQAQQQAREGHEPPRRDEKQSSGEQIQEYRWDQEHACFDK